MSRAVFDLIAEQMNNALDESRRSLDWYYFIVEPLMARYRIPVDGDFMSRRWWFVLRPIQ